MFTLPIIILIEMYKIWDYIFLEIQILAVNMIRRNHNQSGYSMNRQNLRINSQQHPLQNRSSAYRQSQKHQTFSDENMSLWSSNNKKYQQYKLQRQSKGKTVVKQFKDDIKSIVAPLEEIQQDRLIGKITTKDQSNLKREYPYNSDENLKIDYNSISIKQNSNKRDYGIIGQKVGNTTVEPFPVAKYQSYSKTQVNSYKNSLDKTIAFSPPKGIRNANFENISIQKKEQIQNKLSSLADEHKLYKYSGRQGANTDRQTLFGRNIDVSYNKPLKTDYQNQVKYSRPESTYKRTGNPLSIKDSPSFGNKQFYSNLRDTSAFSYKQPSPQQSPYFSVPTPQSSSFLPPTLPPSYQSQQVSGKLRMISDFNDQINERIKNIITCFQGLKNKL